MSATPRTPPSAGSQAAAQRGHSPGAARRDDRLPGGGRLREHHHQPRRRARRASRAAPTCITSRPARRSWRRPWSSSPSAAASGAAGGGRRDPARRARADHRRGSTCCGRAMPARSTRPRSTSGPHARTDPELRERLVAGRAPAGPRDARRSPGAAVRRPRRAARIRAPAGDGDRDDAGARAAGDAAPRQRAQPQAMDLLPRAAGRPVRTRRVGTRRDYPCSMRAGGQLGTGC